MDAVKDPKKAQEIAESRSGKMAKSLIPATAKVSLEELSKRIAESGQQELRVIIKGDVQGSVEALADAMTKLSTEKVRLSVINAAVGAITEGDVNLAIASQGHHRRLQRPPGGQGERRSPKRTRSRSASTRSSTTPSKTCRGAMEGLLPPTLVEKQHGKAEVRQIFKVKGVAVAGCYVTEGKIVRSGEDAPLARRRRRLGRQDLRASSASRTTRARSLEGFECGISLEGFNDLKEKDIIECYEVEEIKQKLLMLAGLQS